MSYEEKSRMNSGKIDARHELRPFRKMLVGLDISEQTSRVIEISAYLARTFSAEILACSVAQVRTGVRADELDGLPVNKSEQDMLDKLNNLIREVFGSGREEIGVKILHGDPAERLVEYAEYSNCDLIVVGSRGHGPLKTAIMGSVSRSVVARSKKSVLIVK